MTETTVESIDAMIARCERACAADPEFVFEVDGSPLLKLACRHVRYLWFAALGQVTSGDKGGQRVSDESIRLYDAVCKFVATPERFELPTVSLGRTCSIQLSYGALPRVS